MAGYGRTVLNTSGLIGCWELGQAEGNEVDLKGNGLTAVVKGAPLRAQPSLLPGGEGRSAKFSSGNFFEVAHNALLNFANTWSIEVWLKLETGASAEAQNIASKGSGAYYGRLFTEEGLRAQMLRSQIQGLAKSGVLATNTVYHVVFTKSGSTRKVWINGVDVTVLQTDSTCVNTSTPLVIGQSDAGFAGNFQGWMQYLSVYNVALSESTVKAHFNAGSVATGLVLGAANGVANASLAAKAQTYLTLGAAKGVAAASLAAGARTYLGLQPSSGVANDSLILGAVPKLQLAASQGVATTHLTIDRPVKPGFYVRRGGLWVPLGGSP